MPLILSGRRSRRPPSRHDAGPLPGFTPALVTIFGLLAVAIVAGHLTDSTTTGLWFGDFPLVAGGTFTLVGAFVVPRQPHSPVGWLFVAIGLCGAVALLGHAFSRFAIMGWLYPWLGFLAYGLLPMVLLLFPDGSLPSRRWRPVAVFVGVSVAATVVPIAVGVWVDPQVLGVGWRGDPPAWMVLARFGFLATILGTVAAVVSLFVRWRRAVGDVRQQLKWLALGASFIPVGIVGQVMDVPAARWLPAITVPLAASFAMLRFRLYDVDLYLNRSVVYTSLTVVLVGAYIAVVTALGNLFEGGEEWHRLVAAGVLVVAFEPLRARVQRGANRLLYGDRDDPYAVVSRLARRLEQAVEPRTVLAQVAEAVAEALQLPYVAIELVEGIESDDPHRKRSLVSHGRGIGEPEAFPMTYQGVVVGRLLVSPRAATDQFTAAERLLLKDLARHAGLAARTVGLTADLQRSRERLVRSREEERRRLRRELHDGLGPALAGMTMQVGAARALVPTAPERVEQLLGDLERQLQACVREVRQLVDDLVPSTLDRMGLVGAIRYRTDAFTEGSGLTIRLDAPADLPELPAAVELAAYRIATEAATNALRHASASAVDIRLAMGDGLVVEVTDNGRGIAADAQPGVGLASMRERTDELGGAFAVDRLTEGGTRVRAVLPLAGS